MIYFLKHKETGLIKIGTTKNFDARFMSLRSKFGVLELLGLMVGYEEEERNLHTLFKELNVRKQLKGREWFKADTVLLTYIKKYTSMNHPLPIGNRKRFSRPLYKRPLPANGDWILSTRLPELIEQYQENNRKPDGSKYSQVEIAVMAGVNPSTLSRYIFGHTESYNREVMGKIAKVLGIEDAGELFVFEKEADE